MRLDEFCRRQDRGTTLVELTVAMLVFGLFATYLSSTVLQTVRVTQDAGARQHTAQRASVVMAQLTRDLRTAARVGPAAGPQTAFVSATPTEVVFHSQVEPAPVRERLFVDATGLWRETKIPDDGSVYPDLRYTSTDPARTTTRLLAKTELSATGLFTYFVRGSVTGVTTVAAADVKDITAITVTVSLDGDGSGPRRPVVLSNTVRPYNT